VSIRKDIDKKKETKAIVEKERTLYLNKKNKNKMVISTVRKKK